MDGASPEKSLSGCSLADLEAQITELAGHLNAANYRWLTLIGEFDRRQGWWDGSLHSCAHWLNFKVGLNLGAAREKVRVAHALAGVPKIAAAMARGELSYSKVRALTRVATAATEENLLMIALHGTAYHVERVVSLFRRAQEAEELSREAQQQAGRAVDYWYDTDGSPVLKARLPALAGALLVKALEAALEGVPATKLNVEFAEDLPLSYQTRRADALARVAESYLQNADYSAAAAPSVSTADRYQVVVHVDAETLKDRTAGRCHLEHGPSLPAETVRRLTWPQDPQHPAGDTPRAQRPRSGMLFPGLHVPALSGCPPCRALGRRRGDQTQESGDSVPHSSSAGARRRHHRRGTSRRRMALRETRWARVQHTGSRTGTRPRLDGDAGRALGVGNSDRQRHRGHELERRADGLRTRRLGAVPSARTRAARTSADRARNRRRRRFRGNARLVGKLRCDPLSRILRLNRITGTFMAARPKAVATVKIDEPHVRVTEFRFAPGAETGWHRHEYDYVVVPLLDGNLRLEEPGGASRIAELQTHQPYARLAGVEHNVINANPFEYAFLEVEHLRL